MRRLKAWLFAALVCVAPVVRAQSPVTAEIPFRFAVFDNSYEPGQWTFLRTAADPSGVMVMRSLPRGEAALFVVTIDATRAGSIQPVLIFHRYGDRYFLREIRTGQGITAFLRAGREERQLLLAGVKRSRTVLFARLK